MADGGGARAQELVEKVRSDEALRTRIEQESDWEARGKILAEAGYGDVKAADVQAILASDTSGAELSDLELELVSGGAFNFQPSILIDPKSQQGGFAGAVSGGKPTLGQPNIPICQVPPGCFITTACVEARGLPDDCAELRTIRSFRDRYVAALPEGASVIAEYYDVAPRILAGIDRSGRARAVYADLYERLVARSVELIAAGEDRAAYENYAGIVTELKAAYLRPVATA